MRRLDETVDETVKGVRRQRLEFEGVKQWQRDETYKTQAWLEKNTVNFS